MARGLLIIVAMLVGVAVTLAASLAVYLMATSIEQMPTPLARGLAVPAALIAGVALLVGSVLISVKLAVAIGARPNDSPPTARVDVQAMQQKMSERVKKLSSE